MVYRRAHASFVVVAALAALAPAPARAVVNLLTANNYLFDIVPNAGYIANGGIPNRDDSYDSWFSLQVGTQGFVGSGFSTPDDGRTVFCLPATLSGLSV